ncbi:serine hydrolase domain-containing protein [Jiulongibacter sediminis]|uniref:Beta-lactamase-related domain-containing protein n=1 Tax=Jiulongibacter sediminis TaxID=1605367 RepID=A0A0P7C259_9BACT|nr:serine hydrolase domain-containing protein [Jiulongibacter sediminis]KPM47413.1 hypothetical protein AFM12_14770 [Jiulongibacter sediminis]TBX22993.1 hypothetical protein TK44_14780 [Jiulongibacter sediminis]
MYKSYSFVKPALLSLLFTVFFACEKSSPDAQNPIPKEPETQEDIAEIDNLVTGLMTKYNIPGASLAIAKNEKLVYLKGLGVANTSTNEPMTSDHLLRIASTSKAYTGLAIMKLQEQGLLNINDKVFGSGALLGNKYGTKTYTEHIKNITVGQLLHNTSGAFVNANGYDLINTNDNLSDNEYMNWLMDNSFTTTAPGEAYYYNNVNFFVACMVVEELSGMSFIDFVKKEILAPIGDSETTIAMNSGNHPKEVTYYGQGNLVNNVYNFNIERYKGAGAMVSNARSLLKFALALDAKGGREDLLSSNLLATFRQVTPLQPNWAHGVGIWGNRTYMYGSLPGTRSGWMIEPSTGLSAAIIFNSNIDYTNASLNQEFAFAVQDVLVDLITKNRAYKDIDQFK